MIKEFNNKCCNSYIFSLPLAFDESLSYLEQQCAILKKLNEVIEQVNKNTEVIDNINLNFEEIFLKLDKMQKEITNFENSIEEEITNFENEVTINMNNRFTQIYNQLVSLMNDYQASFTLQLQTAVNDLNDRIDRIELGNINAYNPTTGRVENINKVLTDIYDAVRYNALTCTEFDSLQYTATEFDSVEITAFNFDNNSKSILTNT